MSLFSTFYRHWRTEDRSALETFLTHTLAYILESLTQLEADTLQRFVPDVLLAAKTPGPDSHKSLKKLKERLSSNLRWVSEDRISVKDGSKRPDLPLRGHG